MKEWISSILSMGNSLTEPTQPQKSIAILKALGRKTHQLNGGSFKWGVAGVFGHPANSEEDAWIYHLANEEDPYESYEICFEEIVPMMFQLNFMLKMEKYESDVYCVYFHNFHSPGPLTFEAKNPDIRIAICEATYSYLKAENKI